MKMLSRKTKYAFFALASVFFIAVFLTGCSESKEQFNETTLKIEKKGKITENIVESFDKDYYSLEELNEEFAKEIGDYNSTIGSEEIKFLGSELKDDEVFVKIEFNGPSDYESFLGEELFIGSIEDACDNGYSMNVSLKGVENGDIISRVQIMGMKDRSIVILSEPVKVKLYSDIAYVSANVDVVNSKEARILSESGGLAYIVLK